MACANPTSSSEQEVLGSKINYLKSTLIGQNLEAIFKDGLVIDFQYFRNRCNQIMVKEFAFIDMGGKTIQCVTFKPESGSEWNKLPEFTKRTNQFIAEHINGLDFCDGNYDYELLIRFALDACKSKSLIFAKGSEKCKFLTQLIGKRVYNLELILGFFSVEYSTMFSSDEYCNQFLSCSFGHQSSAGVRYCSLNKLFRLYDRFQKFQSEKKDVTHPSDTFSPTLKPVIEVTKDDVSSSKVKTSNNSDCLEIYGESSGPNCFLAEDLYMSDSDSSDQGDEISDQGVEIL
jgi:hypothetical protein